MIDLAQIRRSWAFGRHVPARKVIRRAELALRRRASLRTAPRLPGTGDAGLELARSLPEPLFPPRAGHVEQDGERWRFTFLGRRVEMVGGIDWSILTVEVRDQLWRMNLHYMEYLEELPAAAGAAAVRSWISANPPWRAGYWKDSWNSYTVSLRTVVWMQQFPRLADLLGPDERAEIADSLARQIHFLEANLETDLGGNHLVKNIKALLWASSFFEGKPARRWRRKGLRLLERELEAQVLADGMHYERSPSYHAQVFADLLEVRSLFGADPLAGRLDGVLNEMAQALADLAHADGGPALFNDSGLAMAYSPAACLAAMARVTGRRLEPSAGAFALPHAGYFGLRAGDIYLVADMGRIGPDDLPAHAHGDVGSFELSVAGERLIVDQGVFEYVEGERRALSRSTAAHNALALAGADQADFFGAFRCGRRPDVTVREWTAHEDGFVLEGAHDGYALLPGRPIAVRRIEADRAGLRLLDWVEGRTDRAASTGLLLHPEATIVRRGEADLLIQRGRAAIRITASAPIGVERAVYWPDMGVELATSRLRVAWPDARAGGEIVIRKTDPRLPSSDPPR